MKDFARIFVLIMAFAIFGTPLMHAQSDGDSAPEMKTVLILNSYNENSPMAKSVIDPVNYYTAQKEDMRVEIVHFNSTLITDSTIYEKVRANVLAKYVNKRNDIDYVVFIGNLAFTLRDEVKEVYGDIPMLLITRDLTNAPLSYYFSGFDKRHDYNSLPSIAELRPEYNFSVIYVPDLYKETIDLMVSLIPDMEEFVYLSDAVYFNHYLSEEIENYLLTEYPNIQFRYAKATYESSDLLSYYLVHRMPSTGLLLSSWFYETQGVLGYPTLVSGEMSLLSSSRNPVFSLRKSYMGLGAVGGVYVDPEKLNEAITNTLEAMINGESMRDLSFSLNRESSSKVTMVNYPLLMEYKLDPSKCPKGTVYVDKPRSFWDKYHWQTLAVVVLIALIIYYLARRNTMQRHEIETLGRHKQFVDNMPIPYTKARVIYNDYMNAILNIKYTMSNQAFDELVRENSDPRQPGQLFSPEFISEKTREMLEGGRPVSFLHHFNKTNKYYIITICLVDSVRHNSKDVVDTIDIFAIDVTQRQKSEEELKSITRRLDMVIDVANLIPWEWEPKPDIMKFDAYSMFHRLKRSFDDGHLNKGQSIVNTSEFMKLVYPEDREVVRRVREQLLLGEISEFDVEYRLVIARQNQEKLEWVTVRGAVTETDENGLPVQVMGSMIVITDRKDQEMQVAEANRKSAQAEVLKSSFVNNISREIRVQLNAIVGFANLINETDDPEKRQQFMGYINTNTQELLDFVDQMVEDASSQGQELAPLSERTSTTAPVPVQKPEQKPAQKKAETKSENKEAAPKPEPKPEAEKPEVAAPAPKRDTNKPLVLVAEDLEGNYLLLKHYIPKDYELIHAWTGKEALDMFLTHHPDIILMDIGMPVMDGYKATSEIRKYSTSVPIVAVTAYTSNSDRELILQSGFDDYVAKPVSRSTIIDTLKRYLPTR